jgi:hypothetical protein
VRQRGDAPDDEAEEAEEHDAPRESRSRAPLEVGSSDARARLAEHPIRAGASEGTGRVARTASVDPVTVAT